MWSTSSEKALRGCRRRYPAAKLRVLVLFRRLNKFPASKGYQHLSGGISSVLVRIFQRLNAEQVIIDKLKSSSAM